MAFIVDKRRYSEPKSFGNNVKHNNNSFKRNFKGSRGSKSDKQGSKYYCTHCEIPGHNIDRCFKVHGYPANFKGFKDKRVAALSNNEITTAMDIHDTPSTSLSMNQYNQLMTMLKSNSNTTGAQPMMAGNSLCSLSFSDSKWLLDSGATYPHFL